MQSFDTLDVLRLEVAEQPTGLVNLIANPNGELGGWGWVTPVPNTTVNGFGTGLTFKTTAGQASYFTSEFLPLAAGAYVAGRLVLGGPPTNPPVVGLAGRWEFYNAAKTLISSSGQTGFWPGWSSSVRAMPLSQAPAGTVYVKLRLDMYRTGIGTNPSANDYVVFNAVTVATGATAGALGSLRTNLATYGTSFQQGGYGWTGAYGTVLSIVAGGYAAASALQLVLANAAAAAPVNAGGSWIARNSNTTVTHDTTGTDGDTWRATAKAAGATAIAATPYAVAQGNAVTFKVRARTAALFPVLNTLALAVEFGTLAGSVFTVVADSGTVQTAQLQGLQQTLPYVDVTTPAVAVPSGVTHARLKVTATNTNSPTTAQPLPIDYAQLVATATSTGLAPGSIVYGSGEKIGDSSTPLTPGKPYAIQLRAKSIGTAQTARLIVQWYTSSSTVFGDPVVIDSDPIPLASYVQLAGVVSVPGGAAYARVRVDSVRTDGTPAAAGDGLLLDAIMVEQSDTIGTWFDGDEADAGGVSYDWSGTPGRSASTRSEASQLDYIAPTKYLSILGSGLGLSVERDELDVGSLTGTIADATLDPSQTTILRPGRACRLTALVGASWEPIFTGTLRDATVSYDLRDSSNKRARIALTATDAVTELGNVGRSEGVATIAELPAVLEGAGVPWNVNGSGDQVPTAVIVARNDSATALDQLGVTRDSALGYAWVDRKNIVNAWDADQLPAVATDLIDESVYTDLAIDYDTDRCVNHVTVKFLRLNPDSGESEEVTYGPYVDQPSIDEWGPHAETFTVQWQIEDPAQIAAYAGAILAANAQPARRINSVTFPLRTPADVTNLATLDLLDLVTVVNAAAGLSEPLRIRGIRHAISSRSWTVELTFARDGSVSAPVNPPNPSQSAEGLTLTQLLRPVGEVTMWYGSKAACPSGWLVCDGSSFSSSAYPALYALLGTTLLPDFNDRTPAGASTAKPLGSAGGAALKALPSHTHTHTTPDHVHYSGTLTTGGPSGTTAKGTGTQDAAGPNHTHGVTGQTGVVVSNPAVTSSGPSAATIDVTDPYRAVHFLIRAR